MSYIVDIKENEDGDLVVDLPPEILEQLGWEIGDTILWEETENGCFKLTKKDVDK